MVDSSSIYRKRFVTVGALILGLCVSGVVLAIIVTGRNWFSSLNPRFYRFWCCVIWRWRHECARSDIVQNCQKRFLRRSIVFVWHRHCWAITDGVTLACNILFAFSRSTSVRFGSVNYQRVIFNIINVLSLILIFLNVFTQIGSLTSDFSSYYMCKSK